MRPTNEVLNEREALLRQGLRRCIACQLAKPADAYGKLARTRDGLQTMCKDCVNERNRRYTETIKAADPAAYRERQRRSNHAQRQKLSPEQVRRQNLRRYKFTPEQYEEMLAAQGGACAICRTTEPGGRNNRFHIDHDHKCCPRGSCGRCVRGLLCVRCNHGIANFNEDPAIFSAALAYLRHHLSST